MPSTLPKSGDSTLHADLNRRRDPNDWYHQVYRTQWTDDEFKPIAKAMDGIFKGLGWVT